MKVEIDTEILQEALDMFGIGAQIRMVVEECAELTDALMKYQRGRVGEKEVITEIADVQIMCAQMELAFGGSTKVVEMERMRKIDRLRDRLAKLKGKNGTS